MCIFGHFLDIFQKLLIRSWQTWHFWKIQIKLHLYSIFPTSSDPLCGRRYSLNVKFSQHSVQHVSFFRTTCFVLCLKIYIKSLYLTIFSLPYARWKPKTILFQCWMHTGLLGSYIHRVLIENTTYEKSAIISFRTTWCSFLI